MVFRFIGPDLNPREKVVRSMRVLNHRVQTVVGYKLVNFVVIVNTKNEGFRESLKL